MSLIADAPNAFSIDDLASALGIHRSIAYRLVRTLEQHRLVSRDSVGRLRPGFGLAVLARHVSVDLRSVARPILIELADTLAMTAFLVERDGSDAVTVETAEPTSSAAHVAYRPGHRHPIDRGAPGLALLAGAPPTPHERTDVAVARSRGWARSESEVLPGMASIAAPIAGTAAAVAVVWLAGSAVAAPEVADAVTSAARRIAEHR